MQIQSLHYQLQHKSGNLAKERAVLRHLTQLKKAKGKEKASDEAPKHGFSNLDSKEQIASCTEWITSQIDMMSKEELDRRNWINQLEKEKDALDKRIKFLERKLAQLYRRKEAAIQ